MCHDFSLTSCFLFNGFLMCWIYVDVALLIIDPPCLLFIDASYITFIVYMFSHCGICEIPSGIFHPGGVMSVDFLFLTLSSLLISPIPLRPT